MKLIVAIHGILTSQTDASWPDRMDAWVWHRDARARVLKKEYRAGPWPMWNVWVKDPHLARGLVREIELFMEDTGAKPELWFVAHSNGCVIALQTIRRLIEKNIYVSGLIFTGGACDGVVEDNGIWQWIEAGKLGRAVSFSSAEDDVVKWKFIWPYGHLGRTGWQCRVGGSLVTWTREKKAWTEWFKGYGHSGYFQPAHLESTFSRMWDIMAPS